MSHKDTAASKLDTDALEWQLDRMFAIWNITIYEIGKLVQAAGTYRPTVVLDRVHNALFNSEDFLDWAKEPDKILLTMFMLALEIKYGRVTPQ